MVLNTLSNSFLLEYQLRVSPCNMLMFTLIEPSKLAADDTFIFFYHIYQAIRRVFSISRMTSNN